MNNTAANATTARLYRADAFEDGHAVAYCYPEYDTAYRCTYGPSDGIINRIRRENSTPTQRGLFGSRGMFGEVLR